jgi:hypothetical protein
VTSRGSSVRPFTVPTVRLGTASRRVRVPDFLCHAMVCRSREATGEPEPSLPGRLPCESEGWTSISAAGNLGRGAVEVLIFVF